MKFSLRILKNKNLFKRHKWNKAFKSGPSKICGRQPLKNLKGYLYWYTLSSIPCKGRTLFGTFENKIKNYITSTTERFAEKCSI